jgi:hypothetical protein
MSTSGMRVGGHHPGASGRENGHRYPEFRHEANARLPRSAWPGA